MDPQAGITAFLITLLYPQNLVKIITKVQTFIELAFLPFPSLSLGSMRWWREGLIFCHIFLPSLLLTPSYPPPHQTVPRSRWQKGVLCLEELKSGFHDVKVEHVLNANSFS